MSKLTNAQEEDIIQAFKASKDMEWCSGVVSWPSATLPLFYVTRNGRNRETGDSPLPLGTAGHNDNAEPEVT